MIRLRAQLQLTLTGEGITDHLGARSLLADIKNTVLVDLHPTEGDDGLIGAVYAALADLPMAIDLERELISDQDTRAALLRDQMLTIGGYPENIAHESTESDRGCEFSHDRHDDVNGKLVDSFADNCVPKPGPLENVPTGEEDLTLPGRKKD